MLVKTISHTKRNRVFFYYPGGIIQINLEKHVDNSKYLSKVEQKSIMEKALSLESKDLVLNVNSTCVLRGSLIK